MLATKMTKMHSVASNFAFEPARKQSSKTKNRSSLKKYLCSQETQQSQWRSHSRTTRCRAPAFRGATLLRNTLALWPWHLLKRLTSPTKNRSVVMLSCIEALTAKKPKLNAFIFPTFLSIWTCHSLHRGSSIATHMATWTQCEPNQSNRSANA